MLKSGALLMRLNSVNNKVEYLKNQGAHDRAKEIENDSEMDHQRIMQTFHDEFVFANVYFFHAKDALLVKEQKFNQVSLLNMFGETQTDLSFLESGYLIAAFDRVYDAQIIPGDYNQKEIKTTNSSIPALVVYDSNFIQLQKPFPYKVVLDPRSGRKYKAIKELN